MQTLTRVLPPLRLIMFCQSGENPAQFPDTGPLRGGLRSSQDTRRAAGSVASVARRDGDIRRTAINPASAVATGFSALSADSGFLQQ